MELVADVAAMLNPNDPVLDADTVTEADTTSESISDVSWASMVKAPVASTRLPPATRACVAPVTVLLAIAAAPAIPPEKLLEAETVTDTAAVLAKRFVSSGWILVDWS